MKKRIFSLLLALCLVAGMLPTVAYAAYNTGTIDSGEFTQNVDNLGTINGGTFNGEVTNQSNGFIYGGVFNSTVNNIGGGHIYNGTFNSMVNNANSIIHGGTFHGAVTNDGEISGGTFYDTVINNGGIIEGGTFYGTVTGSGNIIDSAKVTITFDSDGGSSVTEQKVLKGQKATEPTAPTKEGYTFEGWYKGNTEFDFANTHVTENITLTAKWVVGTKLTKEILEANYKQSSLGSYIYVLPSGNYYLGKDISVETRIDIGTDSTPTQNVVLDLNGYKLEQNNRATLLYPRYSSTLTLIDSSSAKTGKVISSLHDTVSIGSNSKLNANGGTVIGTVNLSSNNAVIDNTDPLNVTVFRDGQICGANSSAVINGGIFYSTVDNCDGQITGGTFYGTVNCDKIRESAKVTVTFNSDGGSTVDEQKVLRGQKATAPTAPTKVGYNFVGWYNGNATFDFANTPVIENITLSAKWTPKTYHVELNTNGADSCAELIEYTYGIGATLPTPVKAGYTFVSWYAANDFSGDSVTSISITDTEDKVFYAKWDEKSEITFNTAPQTCTYNGSVQAFEITGTDLTGFDISYKQNGQTVTNPTNAGSYDVTITRAEDNTYKAVDVTISGGLVINPATPTENPTKKTTARVVRGRTLADATVTNGEILGVDSTTPLTGTFAWVDSTKVMSADGTEQMVFTPDNTNYASITIDVAVSAYSTGSGSSTPTYAPTVNQPDNGTVTVSPKSPRKGDTVTITPKPDAGYTVEQVLVTDKNGDPVEVINNGDGTYSFTQPAGKVNINVTFMEDNSMLNFFVDVPADAYYYDAVLWAAENDITGGVDDTHFSPNAPCTRAQIVTFLWRAAGCPEPESLTSLSDVPADAYYAEAVAWALENGITTGTGDGTTFSPDVTCTRAQAMTFIYRSEQAQGGGMQGAWMFQNPFSDVDLESYYGEAVMWAVANGVTDGTTATTFSPGADCTRAQIVTFLFRCLGGE
ncbi:MAG: hypothetical protein DBY24_08990 [Prevotellaceae bacterium]|nr:MAG: hypothetical protein DBY24_08990 [Prevotellaceae bacterium]